MRLILVDDSVLFRSGLDRLLREAGFDVVGHAASGDEVMALLDGARPDVVIMDIRLPPGHRDEGLLAARAIRDRAPEVGLLLLSQYAEPAYAADVIALGSRGVGYLLKDRVSQVPDLVDAVDRVARGGSALDPAVVRLLLGVRRRDPGLETLTERERAVVALMAEGHANEGICRRLFLAPKTVETHVRNIFSKLGLAPTATEHRRVMAVLRYLRSDVDGD